MVKPFEKRVWKGKYLVPESRQKSKGGYRPSQKKYGSNRFDKLKIIMVERNNNLHLFVRNEPPQNEYKYLITSYGGTGHTAFHTLNGLKRYLAMTGLRRKFISENSNGKSYNMIGSYERVYLSGNYELLNNFGKTKGLTRTKVLDNGEYTTGYYGNGKIYLLNPNYHRTIYNYFSE